MVKELMDTLYTRWPAPPPDWLIVDYVRLPVANYKQALEEFAQLQGLFEAKDRAWVEQAKLLNELHTERAADKARIAELEALVRERV